MRIALTCLLVATLGAPALASDVKFSSKPSATRAGGKVKIAFAASSATDVEVAVLDSRGKVIRHLAAGKLGADGAGDPAWARDCWTFR